MWTDIARLAVLPVLLGAAAADVRTRLVHSRAWRPAVAVASACLLADAWAGRGTLWVALLSAAGLGGLSYAAWLAGGLGMADVKALVVVALAFPVQPALHPALPLLGPAPVFPLQAALYAVLLAAAWPLRTAAENALSGRWSADMASVRLVDASDLPSAHGWLRETGELIAEADELPSEGRHEVEPAMPFLVPLLGGLLLAILVGAP
jgi:preflagellin peptidase FlaK